ncbi:cytochrome P450 [Cercophora scortea]|uniref:Cytochrome P450 n=1 Tax=Cercophora scortea TaxID=314031 RepID=A0AAE0IVM4_9PEZI|nr:cytochrome P450 [Cercophora scortea]
MMGLLTDAGLGFDSGHATTTTTTTAIAATVAVVSLSLYLALYWMQTRKVHPDEPPIIASPVPFVGQILGMAIWGGRYVKSIGIRNQDKPIFTLPLSPRSRIYIVTDPSLAAAVQRASRTLSFTPLIPDLTKRVLGLDDATVSIVRQNLDPVGAGDPRGFLADMHDLVYTSLSPGEALDELTLSAARELAAQISSFASTLPPEKSKGNKISLLAFIRALVTPATARLLYGPSNPLTKSPSLAAALWKFDAGVPSLLLNILPSLTARKAYLAREALTSAFATYLSNDSHTQSASPLVQKRIQTAQRHGLSLDGTARSELSFLFAGVVNTATTAFWAVARVFADNTQLLEIIREEVHKAVVVHTCDKNDEGVETIELDLKILKTADCAPILHAVLRECLRLGSDNFSTRLVTSQGSSTLLAGKWFLSEGSVVQIAGGVVHADRRVWGENADGFDYKRFLSSAAVGDNDNDNGKGNGKSVHPAAFRAFGGGKTLCPGRHFATREVVALVAMFVLMFDLEAVDGGLLVVPEKEDGALPVHILEPKGGDVQVMIRRREGVGRVVVA